VYCHDRQQQENDMTNSLDAAMIAQIPNINQLIADRNLTPDEAREAFRRQEIDFDGAFRELKLLGFENFAAEQYLYA
jgi:hypothetical protein